MKLLAHRGASHAAPENTLAAFARALDEGADGLECDVRLSADDQAIVFHDADLQRLTGHAGPLANLRAEALAGLRVGGEPIPELADLVAFVAERRPPIVNVELKPLARPAALVAACLPHLEALAATCELVVSSFDPRVLALLGHARGRLQGARLALLFDDPAGLAALAYLPDADAIDLHPPGSMLDATALAAWARPSRRLRVWTIDEPAEARRLLALAPDLTLITNRPGPLRAELSDIS